MKTKQKTSKQKSLYKSSTKCCKKKQKKNNVKFTVIIHRLPYKYGIELKNNNDNIGYFNIVFNANKARPLMGIEIEEKYRGLGLSKYMIKTLLNNLTNCEKKQIPVLYINNNVSHINTGKRNQNGNPILISVWERLGVNPNTKQVTLNNIHCLVS